MAERTAILVTGMHRSGTSALARTLSLLGAKLPDTLVPANEGNPSGHWEPHAVVELNDRMLADAGSDLYGVAEIDPAWFESARANHFAQEARAVIDRAYGGDGLIVSKDPRTALTLPIWNRAFGEAGYRVVHVLALRSPEDVARSLRQRHLKTFPYDAWPRPRGEIVWLRYTLAAIRGSRGQPRSFIKYADLLKDWRGEAERIGRELDIVWPRLATPADQEVDAFLHANAGADSVAKLPPLPAPEAFGALDLGRLAQVLYAILVQNGDAEALVKAIEAQYAARIAGCRDLILAFEGLYPLVWRYFEETKDLTERLATTNSREEQLRHAVQNLWGNLTRATDDKNSLRQDLYAKAEQVASTATSVEQIGNALVEANRQRDDYAKGVEDLGRALVEANRQRDDYAAALEQIGAALVEANQQRDEVMAERNRLQGTLDDMCRAFDQLTVDHTCLRETLKTAKAKIDRLEALHTSHTTEIATLEQERALQRNSLEQLRSDLARITADKRRACAERDQLAHDIDRQRRADEDQAQKLKALQASLSWRVTAPLRVLSRLVGSPK